MTGEFVLYVGRRMMQTALLLAAPVLAVTVVVGFAVAMLQAVTSIRDMTLGMVLKLICVGLTILLAGGWMMTVTVTFAAEVFGHMNSVGR